MMIRVEKIRVVLLCVSVCIIIVVLGVALRDKKPPIVIQTDTVQEKGAEVNIALKNFSYSSVNSTNFKEWALRAESATHYDEEQRVVLEDMVVHFYQEGTDKNYTLKGHAGQLDTKTKNITIEGGAEGILPDNTTIRTDSIFYDHAKRTISTDDAIVIDRGSFVMEGVGMIVDLNTEKLKILGKVKALGN